MNETLEKIMIFINENTNILIGICLFLIFVLIGYLIDNSIKSRRAKKEFKKSQIQTDLNSEYSNEPKKENVNIQPLKNSDSNLFENAISTPKIDIDLSTDDQTNNFDDSVINETKKDIVETDLKDVIGAIDTINTETENIDLSKEELNTNVDVLYKNDKKLSEILFNTSTKEESNQNVKFENNVESEISETEKALSENTTIKDIGSKVEIDLGENELDNIMKKLSNISNIDENDNYTNIF